MTTAFTKFFHFSASHARGEKIKGHNYVLGVTIDPLEEEKETAFEKKVEAVLIKKLDSRDLGTDVDFLKNVEINDLNLLRIFWDLLAVQLPPARLRALSLERDKRTHTAFSPDSA